MQAVKRDWNPDIRRKAAVNKSGLHWFYLSRFSNIWDL